MKNARGFTLIELMVTMILIGIVSIIVSPILGEMTSSRIAAYRAQQTTMNQKVAQAFITYASTVSTTGALPAPYSNGTDTFSAPTNLTSSSSLNTVLQMTGVPGEEVNDDGRAAKNVRVFQKAPSIMYSTPFDVQSGPVVRLLFEYGAVYITTCPRADTSCNKTPLPGASVALTGSNHGSWTTTAPDFGAAYVSTLPVQLAMLAKARTNVYKARDAFSAYFRMLQAASPAATTNFYPNSGASVVANASSNQGCWYNWINLASTSVLTTVGLPPAEFGVTTWGGRIEYCRDYDATGSASADAVPHYGAIRFHRDISGGFAPDTSIASNNVILTF